MSVDKAVQVLEQALNAEIERHRKERAELEDAIGRLRQQYAAIASEAPQVVIHKGQWKDIKPKDALRQYLNDHGGGPVPFSKMLEDMRTAGGGSTWTPQRYAQNWKIVMSNNLKMFYYDENSDTVELIDARRRRA
jgi:superoxide dismutase